MEGDGGEQLEPGWRDRGLLSAFCSLEEMGPKGLSALPKVVPSPRGRVKIQTQTRGLVSISPL